MVMSEKIPIRIEWIAGMDGGGDIEIIMKLDSFESSGTSIRKDIRQFKADYLQVIKTVKDLDVPLSGKRSLSTRRRWEACKILADFNHAAGNKFDIVNYKEAYARDFGIPLRSIRAYLDFGENFLDQDISDKIPYSIYAELVFRTHGLREAGLFDVEKKRLVEMGKAGKIPSRDEYRRQLKEIHSTMWE